MAAISWCLSATTLVALLAVSTPAAAGERTESGILVLYDFAQGEGTTIRDRSGRDQSLDLTVVEGRSVRWSDGSLVVGASTSVISSGPAEKVIAAVRQSREITVEVWLTPANSTQSGPARIVSLSANPNERNFTLGQEKSAYDFRLRTTETSTNGLPSTTSPNNTAKPRLTHVVFTRNAAGSAIVYVDGVASVKRVVGGDFGNWDGRYHLTLANERTGERPWLGELHLVAIYDRALPVEDVRRNFAAGHQSTLMSAEERAVAAAAARQAELFNSRIAPLFARHCLECHDAAIRKGELDLSRRTAAMSGGESGKVMLPGNSNAGLLLELVDADEMPKDRAPLKSDEKSALREWLAGGATWTTDVIDPAIFAHADEAGEIWVQRLTVSEYVTSVRHAVNVDISEDARKLLPPDLRADGFSNTAYNLNIDLKHVAAYRELAGLIVARMDIPKFVSRFAKSRQFNDDKMRDTIAAMGKWLLRGPLDEREINIYRGIASTVAAAGGSYDDATGYIVEAMLQSPRFVYRMENHHGDGRPRAAGPYELASRLSYILWGAPPDAALMQAADRDELADSASLERHVDRMLQDPRTVDRSLEFVAEWLNLGRLDNLRPDSERFPHWNRQLAEDMQAETKAYFREVVWTNNRPMAELLNTPVTFATGRLATHYGLESAGDELRRYDVSSVPGRGGLLSQGSVLTVGGDNASMVSRGLFVLHELLRGTVNAPPPCVNTTPPPTSPGLTQRGIAAVRIADANCGVCHARFEPLAFGLEKFDGIGGYHERDRHGNELRDDGEILVPGTAEAVPYQSSEELMNLLAGSERVRESLTWKVVQFSMGRPLVAEDAPVVKAVHESAANRGGTYRELLRALVLSDLVRQSRTEDVR